MTLVENRSTLEVPSGHPLLMGGEGGVAAPQRRHRPGGEGGQGGALPGADPDRRQHQPRQPPAGPSSTSSASWSTSTSPSAPAPVSPPRKGLDSPRYICSDRL